MRGRDKRANSSRSERDLDVYHDLLPQVSSRKVNPRRGTRRVDQLGELSRTASVQLHLDCSQQRCRGRGGRNSGGQGHDLGDWDGDSIVRLYIDVSFY